MLIIPLYLKTACYSFYLVLGIQKIRQSVFIVAIPKVMIMWLINILLINILMFYPNIMNDHHAIL
ncbi:MAG: hypothetical protein A2V67_03070 [Deltaproteobacteria bacterium RBG_13_61_14]|nr:MAG: hypothetical protein A2V67_03070 [Deltaproteobacteria bacterium RBG_13_61_14]